jgi:serine/threonine protein kinase
MHSKNIYHRDMKPENVIYDAETGVAKIIDFGFALQTKEKLRVFCGTPSFMSPEVTQKSEYNGGPADVWSCGVILFLMLTGDFPFKHA